MTIHKHTHTPADLLARQGKARRELGRALRATPAVPQPPSLHHYTPICLPCRRNYRCELNGVHVRLGRDAIIEADMYECPGCGHRLVRGFAHRYLSRHDRVEGRGRIFERYDRLMGDAVMTDRRGKPIWARFDPESGPDCIALDDAAEAVEEGHRWG